MSQLNVLKHSLFQYYLHDQIVFWMSTILFCLHVVVCDVKICVASVKEKEVDFSFCHYKFNII